MTFAVIGKCPETGAIGAGMATFSVNVGRVSPVASGLLPTFQESGAIVLPHSYANRQLAYDTFRMLEQGYSLERLRAELPKTDPYFSYRQYSVLTVAGDLWVHTGDQAFEYAGHIVEGSVGRVRECPDQQSNRRGHGGFDAGECEPALGRADYPRP